MPGKIVLCRCEDVTLADIEHSVSRGYKDIEEVKRYTGFGTGPCQGKECLAVVAISLPSRPAGKSRTANRASVGLEIDRQDLARRLAVRRRSRSRP